MAPKPHELTPDAQAILLLCATLGSKGESPLKTPEYHKLAKWLHEHQARPGDMLAPQHREDFLAKAPLDESRLRRLLERGALLALKVEEWAQRNIWVLTRGDAAYPRRYKQRLQHAAPPVLFGVGNAELLERGGLAIVGSRDVDFAGLSFTRQLAERCTMLDIAVISGGARGVDEEAMTAAVNAGGTIVGVLANDLQRGAVSKKYRQALLEGRAVLVSPYDPAAGFHAGNAMGRNKLVYTLSDATAIVSSDFDKGGTWAGAKENLAANWVPLLVRDEPNVPEGNRALLAKGARALKLPDLAGDTLNSLLAVEAAPPPSAPAEAPRMGGQAVESAGELDLFPIVWPHLATQLTTARSEQMLAGVCHVTAPQMRQWLLRAVEQRLVEKVTEKKKVSYRLLAPTTTSPLANPGQVHQMSLFGT